MGSIQFHPTGHLRVRGPGCPRRPGAKAPSCATAAGETLPNGALRPRSRTLPATWCTRAEFFEIKEGRGAGPDKDYILLDLTDVDPEVIEKKLPDITRVRPAPI